jgi:hypothetical protein
MIDYHHYKCVESENYFRELISFYGISPKEIKIVPYHAAFVKATMGSTDGWWMFGGYAANSLVFKPTFYYGCFEYRQYCTTFNAAFERGLSFVYPTVNGGTVTGTTQIFLDERITALENGYGTSQSIGFHHETFFHDIKSFISVAGGNQTITSILFTGLRIDVMS